MCKRLRDIFFPQNVKGIDERSITTHIDFNTAATIKFVGEYLKVSYDYFTGTPFASPVEYVSKTLRNGDGTAATGAHIMKAKSTGDFSFHCINVTSLICNGEQLI